MLYSLFSVNLEIVHQNRPVYTKILKHLLWVLICRRFLNKTNGNKQNKTKSKTNLLRMYNMPGQSEFQITAFTTGSRSRIKLQKKCLVLYFLHVTWELSFTRPDTVVPPPSLWRQGGSILCLSFRYVCNESLMSMAAL